MTIENDGFLLCVFLGTTNESYCMRSVCFGLIWFECMLHNFVTATFLLLSLLVLWSVCVCVCFSRCGKKVVCSFLSGSRYTLIIYNLPLIFGLHLTLSLPLFSPPASLRHWFLNCSRFSHTFARLRVAHMQIRQGKRGWTIFLKWKLMRCTLCYCCWCLILSFRLHEIWTLFSTPSTPNIAPRYWLDYIWNRLDLGV